MRAIFVAIIGVVAVWPLVGVAPASTAAEPSGWGAATLIETEDAGNANSPQVAVDSQGNAIAVWHMGDGSPTLWANRFVPGTGWGAATLIENPTVSGIYPQVAVDSQGNAIAVWLQSPDKVRASRYLADLGWGFATTIGTGPATCCPRVAIDPAGNVIAVWVGGEGNIWANRFVPGTGWGPATLVEMAGASNFHPTVGVDSQGNAIAVWQQYDGTRNNIWANRYLAGFGWGAWELIETNNAGTAEIPEIAVDAQGNAIAVWYEYEGGNFHTVWTNRFVPGTGWGTATLLGSDTVFARPQVAVDPQGNAIAVWQQADGGRWDAWANRFVPGTGWGTATLIEMEDAGNAGDPQVAMDRDGNGIALWLQDSDSGANIWANRYLAGIGWGGATLIGADHRGGLYNWDIAFDPRGNAVAVWSSGGYLGLNIWANRFVRDSVPPDLILTSPATDLTNDPSVTIAGTTESGATLSVGGEGVSVDSTGAFSVTMILSDGTHTFDVIATDIEGNENAARVTVTVDTMAPAVSLTRPDDGASLPSPTVTVSGTTEPGTTLVVNGLVASVAADGSFAFPLALQPGTNTIRVVARDAAGNEGTVTRTVTYTDPVPGALAALTTQMVVGLVILAAVLLGVQFLLWRRLRGDRGGAPPAVPPP